MLPKSQNGRDADGNGDGTGMGTEKLFEVKNKVSDDFISLNV